VTPAGPSGERWLDKAAGPVIRPYAFVGGRTMHAGERFDLIAMVLTSPAAAADPEDLEPGHLEVMAWCQVPLTVADLAAGLGLPVGVIRVILADLREHGLVSILPPTGRARQPNPHILRRVADGLRRL
jgi:hypothetical protein